MEGPGNEEPEGPQSVPPGARLLLSAKAFAVSRKGLLLLAQAVLSFIIFICYIASVAAPFLTIPLLTFVLALCFFFAYSLRLNDKFKAVYWVLADFLCGIIAAIIYFAISIAAVSKYSDTASKAAGVSESIPTAIRVQSFGLPMFWGLGQVIQALSPERPRTGEGHCFSPFLKQLAVPGHALLWHCLVVSVFYRQCGRGLSEA
uniref:CKLF like MARVEL transmembrane domain containing 3 n=1 Tax=Anolis carolinensis TaxID=28377 RepID=A0A803SSU6_ANOCA